MTGTLFLRDLRVCWRNPAAVLLVVASPIVLTIVFMAFFRQRLPGRMDQIMILTAGGNAAGLYDGWIFASVAVLAGFTSSAGVFLGFLDDCGARRFELYLASPVRRGAIIWGYLLAAGLVSFIVSLVVVAFGQVWALAAGQPVMSAALWLQALLGLLLTSLFFATLTGLAVGFVSSQGGFAGYCLIGGSLAGFLTASYALPQGAWISQVAGLLPFAQAAALIRAPLVAPVIGQLPLGSGPNVSGFAGPYTLNYLVGAKIQILGGTPWPALTVVIVLVVWSAILLGLGLWRLYRVLRTR